MLYGKEINCNCVKLFVLEFLNKNLVFRSSVAFSFNISKKTEFDFYIDLLHLLPFILILLYFTMDPLSFNSIFSLVSLLFVIN